MESISIEVRIRVLSSAKTADRGNKRMKFVKWLCESIKAAKEGQDMVRRLLVCLGFFPAAGRTVNSGSYIFKGERFIP